MDSGWKKWERRVAEALGGRRTGPRGFNLPDVEGIDLAVECKLQAKLSLKQRDLEQAQTNAKGRPWILALKERNSRPPKEYIVMPFDQFVEMWRKYGQ